MIPYFFALIFMTTSCNDSDDDSTSDDDGTTVENPDVAGMNYVLSDRSFTETYDILRTALDENPNITIVAEVDHQSNASSIDLDLNPTRVILFGNPALGTSLMQENQQAGIDLPNKMLVYQNSDDDVFIGYNNTDFLARRHSVGEAETLPMIAQALANLSGNAGDAEVVENGDSVQENEGIVNTVSEQLFTETYDKLLQIITDNPNLNVVATLDHAANAQTVNEQLLPTRLIVFGNPNLGTPLMQSAQTTGIDLPQKMLVYQNADSEVIISYNNPQYLASRHGITGNEDLLVMIQGALQGLADAASVAD